MCHPFGTWRRANLANVPGCLFDGTAYGRRRLARALLHVVSGHFDRVVQPVETTGVLIECSIAATSNVLDDSRDPSFDDRVGGLPTVDQPVERPRVGRREYVHPELPPSV